MVASDDESISSAFWIRILFFFINLVAVKKAICKMHIKHTEQ